VSASQLLGSITYCVRASTNALMPRELFVPGDVLVVESEGGSKLVMSIPAAMSVCVGVGICQRKLVQLHHGNDPTPD
jgi:hypothetical protein